MSSNYTPRSRQSLRLGWTRGDWGAGMSVLRVGHMEYLDGSTVAHISILTLQLIMILLRIHS